VIGSVIGNFRVVGQLGKGGMGEVYVAEHVGIQTRVAIKVLLPEISRNADHVHRLFNEARIVSRIKHAGIAKIFDVGFHDGQAYLVMELLEGESLAQRIRRQGAFATAELADIGRQVASVLAATHTAGVTHRDLKPDNIFIIADDELDRRERVKVLDFGIAKLAGGTGPHTIGTMGTPEYMAPEQWGDSGSVDWRADAYSLGCVLYEMATGRPPFPSATIVEAYRQHTQSTPVPPRTAQPQLPVDIEHAILRLLAKDPAARAAASISEVARALEPWCGGAISAVYRAASEPGWTRAPSTLRGGAGEIMAAPRARRGWFVGAGIAVVIAATLASVIVIRRGDETPRAAAPASSSLAAPASASSVVAPTTTPATEPVPVPAPPPPEVVAPTPAASPAPPPSAVRAPKRTAPRAGKPATGPAPTASPPAPVPAAPTNELEGRT
jgi:eukaryotic-like serine/threonine-protein kinase